MNQRWDDERRYPHESRGWESRGRDWPRDDRDARGFLERLSDELRSWFGDEDAQRRRMMDERSDWRGERRGERRDWESRDWGTRDWGTRDWGREQNTWGREPEPRDWSRQVGYVDTRGTGTSAGSGDRWRDWSRGWGASSGMGGRDQEWGGQGPGGFGVYRGTLSEQRESGGPWRGERDWGRFSGAEYGQSYGREWATGMHTGRGPRSYQRSDERLHEEVCERMAHHPHLDATDIEVRVQNGEITLSGSVQDRWAKRWAEDVSEGIWGVKQVHNQIRVTQAELGKETREGQSQEGQRGTQQPQRGPWAA